MKTFKVGSPQIEHSENKDQCCSDLEASNKLLKSYGIGISFIITLIFNSGLIYYLNQ